jgi:hypothetical protein
VAPGARVARAGTELVGGARATVFELRPGDGAPSGKGPSFEGLRKWRNKASIGELQGRVVVDDATGALVRCDLTAKFTTPGDAKPIEGTVDVHSVLSDVAATAPIEKPAAEDLAMRQRTAPEQKELLRGLGQARAVAEPPRPGARPLRPAVAKPASANPGAPKTGATTGATKAGVQRGGEE